VSAIFYLLAAAAEIAGCFAFWAWLRLGRSVLWVGPGVLALVIFALALTRIETDAAGRAYAAYGGPISPRPSPGSGWSSSGRPTAGT
jgi:small multidrug resistance family-3 protein